MSISPLYIPLFTLEEVFLDKDTGLPLSGGIVKFYSDIQNANPKVVYQLTGAYPNYTFTSVGNELTLGLSGTFVDINGNPFVPYAYPYDASGNLELYYVTVESSGLVPQFVRHAVPYTGDDAIDPSQRSNTENELSNPQFVEVYFPTSGATTLSVTGANTVTKIAPDWDLITSGTGTVIVERLEPTSASIATNPPYALRINADSALGSTIQLRQRLTKSPSVLRGVSGAFVSATLTARVISGGGTTLSLEYAPSTGTPTTIIPSTNIPVDGAYHSISNNASVTDQANDPASTGYVDIKITIPTARNIAITSIQIVGVGYSINIPFDQQTTGRQKDHLFHYYEDSILQQPKQSLLSGWIFGLNPWQFRSTTPSNLANNAYTADQTIVVQQAYVTTATANNISVGAGTVSENRPLKVAAVTATNKFALIQYIAPATMNPYWNTKVSSLVKVTISSPTHNTSIKFKMRLIYRTSLPSAVGQNEPIASWTNTDGSNPTFAAGWTELKPLTDPEFTASPNVSTTFAFDEFNLPAGDIGGNQMLGVVLYTTNNMVETATADQILFDFITLVRNDVGLQTLETYDESLRKCQFYYEKSYSPSVLPTSITSIGRLTNLQNFYVSAPDIAVKPGAFNLTYKTVKNKSPTISFYSPSVGTIDQVDVNLWNGAAIISSTNTSFSANWVIAETAGLESANYSPNSFTSIVNPAAVETAPQATMLYHYTLDSRLGV